MHTLKPVRLRELKIQAPFLLKELRNHSSNTQKSAQRFLKLPDFAGKNSQWIIENADAIQLKHAYQVLAFENNFKSWTDLKRIVVENDCLYKSSCVGFIHSWFNDYQKAEVYHQKHGGYLLSFWKDYVVCGKEYIHHIGLSDYPKQWQGIGYNWVKAHDKEAWIFLSEIAKRNYLNQK